MARTVHYLLVGIDAYPSHIGALAGCVNDVDAFEAYLEQRVKSPGVSLKGQKLTNGQATRQGIIDAFRKNLANAKAGDVAVFYYAGHGSREKAPPELWYLEPDRKNETILPVDSRQEGIYDIADKELAILIKEVADTGAHFTVILDCCHSGSGTRAPSAKAVRTRRAPEDFRERPLTTYLAGAVPNRTETRGARDKVADVAWPVGRHILMAGCRDNQEAKEYVEPGTRINRGAFSYFLCETLSRSEDRLTYRDLFDRSDAMVRSNVVDQNPQFESADPEALDSVFLDGTVKPRPRGFRIAWDESRHAWMMEAGAVHGIAAPTSQDSPSLLHLFAENADADTLNDPSKAVGTATIQSVSAARSVVQLPEGLGADTSDTYKGVPVAEPPGRMLVALEGDAEGVANARQALDSPEGGEKASQFVRLAQKEEAAEYRMAAQPTESGGRYVILKPGEERPIVEPVAGLNAASAMKAVRQLAHIGRWHASLNLTNPGTSLRLSRNLGKESNADVELKIFRVDRTNPAKQPKLISDNEIRLEYERVGNTDKWNAPVIRIEVVNTSQRDLHVGLLNLTQQFGIYTGLQPAGCTRLEPGESFWAVVKDKNGNSSRDIHLSVPKNLAEMGIEEVRDTLKLFVATEPFDLRLNSQGNLEMPRERSTTRSARSGRLGALDRLLNKVQTRAMGAGDDEEDCSTAAADWATTQVSFVTRRPLAAVNVPDEGGADVPLGKGVKVKPHKKLKAKVKIATEETSTRALGTFALPEVFRSTTDAMEPFVLGVDDQGKATRSAGSPASVLELTDIENRNAVTPEDPLCLEIAGTIPNNEVVLPFAFDGEFYLPVGRVERADGASRIVIERLPEPQASPALGETASRSIASSVKIFFRKIVTNILGGEFEYPRLAAADVELADGKAAQVRFVSAIDEVKNRVKAADRILVLIHGILGDCEKLRLGLHETLTEAKANPADLVLAFDYENLNTPIEDTAKALGRKLADAGLEPGHGKHVTILCHSMGGLVSRWFIEKEGGDKVISKLVMMGTPNAGSPWPSYQDWATASLALALNGLTAAAWPATVLGGLAALAERVDTTLDQMKPGSEFLKKLAESTPPASVPYVLLAGNTSLAPSALHVSGQDNLTLAQKLALRLFSKPRLQGVIDLFFKDVPNDIAVTVESMQALPKAGKEKMTVAEVPCDHLCYLRDKAAREKIVNEIAP